MIGAVGDGISLVRMAEELKPDLVILDLVMPMLAGAGLVGTVSGVVPDCKIVVLTTIMDPGPLNAAFDAGATGIVLKTDSGEQLRIAIHRVLAGGAYVSDSVPPGIGRPRRDETPAPPSGCRLTPRQHQILRLVADGHSSRSISQISASA